MARLAHDDALEALLQDMRSDNSCGKPAKGEDQPKKKRRKGEGADIQIGINRTSSGQDPRTHQAAPSILTESRERELRACSAGDDVLWNGSVEFTPTENRALQACSEIGALGSGAHDFFDAREQQRLAADEAVRWRHMSRLAGEFKDIVADKLGNKWQRHFEKWLYSRRAVCPTCPAGCFPLGAGAEADPELQRKLEAAGASEKQASFMAKMAGKASNKAAAALSRVSPGSGKVKVNEIVMKEGDRVRKKFVLSCSGVNMEVNSDHYNKLLALLRRSSRLADQGGAAAAAVFRLLARYSTFQGAHYRAGGFQAAIHGGCFDVLLSDFGCMLECFASPMNCRYEHYCSAHVGTDAAFGSIGSFFSFRPTSGSYEANPPFDDSTIQRMVAHMHCLLSASNEPLNFAIIIPYLPDQKGWTLVYNSPFKRAHLRVLQSEHGYYEGSQHDRITRFRVAPFDTSVIFLQNDAGRAKWPATKGKLRLLREAFKPKLSLNPHALGFQGRQRQADDEDEDADLPEGCARPPVTKAVAQVTAGGQGNLPPALRRPGDWQCPCGRIVFASKAACGKCGAPKPEVDETLEDGGRGEADDGVRVEPGGAGGVRGAGGEVQGGGEGDVEAGKKRKVEVGVGGDGVVRERGSGAEEYQPRLKVGKKKKRG